LYEILGGSVTVSAIREVELADLLRREPVRIDLKQVGLYLGDARVLVTGAGGSIGSELCRQIARFEPERLILFELSENNLYQIHRELKTHCPDLDVLPILGDVRNLNKVKETFARLQPHVVFHAAAHKHVPLMESNVDEVVPNNIFGTRNVLEASQECGVKRFVFISTDKAVNPKSVMGATKRIGELLVQEVSSRKNGAFVAVRFGNVLGSSGSVVPLFKEQIAAGGPVTVTHPDIQRYFMTIPEAVSLIIQSGAMGTGGEIFVLDMGQPVRIRDLAEDLIRLSGFQPGVDIEIVYTGLRPGEKLNEELFTAREQCMATKHQQILIAKVERCDGERLRRGLADLEKLVQSRDSAKIKSKLREIVPEYAPESG
jgi:FlaA1/EpsC-like NDP-sugar epimerase